MFSYIDEETGLRVCFSEKDARVMIYDAMAEEAERNRGHEATYDELYEGKELARRSERIEYEGEMVEYIVSLESHEERNSKDPKIDYCVSAGIIKGPEEIQNIRVLLQWFCSSDNYSRNSNRINAGLAKALYEDYVINTTMIKGFIEKEQDDLPF